MPRPKRVYISANYGDKPNAEAVANAFRALGFIVVSTWHAPDAKNELEPGPESAQIAADKNRAQIVLADVFVMLTFPTLVTGGKFVEFGFATGVVEDVFILGERYENLPCHTSRAKLVKTVSEIKQFLDTKWGR